MDVDCFFLSSEDVEKTVSANTGQESTEQVPLEIKLIATRIENLKTLENTSSIILELLSSLLSFRQPRKQFEELLEALIVKLPFLALGNEKELAAAELLRLLSLPLLKPSTTAACIKGLTTLYSYLPQEHVVKILIQTSSLLGYEDRGNSEELLQTLVTRDPSFCLPFLLLRLHKISNNNLALNEWNIHPNASDCLLRLIIKGIEQSQKKYRAGETRGRLIVEQSYYQKLFSVWKNEKEKSHDFAQSRNSQLLAATFKALAVYQNFPGLCDFLFQEAVEAGDSIDSTSCTIAPIYEAAAQSFTKAPTESQLQIFYNARTYSIIWLSGELAMKWPEKSVPALAPRLQEIFRSKSASWQFFLHAAQVLGKIWSHLDPEKNRSLQDSILAILQKNFSGSHPIHSNSRVQEAVATALAEIWPFAPLDKKEKILAIFEERAYDPDSEIRFAVLNAISNIWKNRIFYHEQALQFYLETKILSIWLESLKDIDIRIRETACSCLHTFIHQHQSDYFSNKLLQVITKTALKALNPSSFKTEKIAEVRAQMVWLIADIAQKCAPETRQEIAEALYSFTKDPTSQVRLAACNARLHILC